jgi:hypothetical protein
MTQAELEEWIAHEKLMIRAWTHGKLKNKEACLRKAIVHQRRLNWLQEILEGMSHG